ncbi:MAG TPA: serine hydrolase domain-containing protein, partial [Chloroflexota bacterium]|nr:serine hydrolase domain-containing protein [Chloroflexota bacterium]
FEIPESQLDRLAANYRREGANGIALIEAPRESAYRHRTYFSGAGGLLSTAHDYMRFCKMLANGGELDGQRLLSPRTIGLMAMNHLPGNQDLDDMAQNRGETVSRAGAGFGLGFAVLMDPAKAQVLGTPGEYYWGGAASTAFFINPAEDLVAIFLTQVMQATALLRKELRVTTYQAIVD